MDKRIIAAIEFLDENSIDEPKYNSQNIGEIHKTVKLYSSLNRIIYSPDFKDKGFINTNSDNSLRHDSRNLYDKLPNISNPSLTKVIKVLHNLIMAFQYSPKNPAREERLKDLSKLLKEV